MTQKIRRNDPCPCGSGKKYKKCCLAQQQADERRTQATASVQERRFEACEHVLKWLSHWHKEALQNAFDEFGEAVAEDPRELSEDEDGYLFHQSVEWVLAEGLTEVDGRLVRLRDLALATGLPALDADQRAWFERCTEEPLRLWRVTRVDDGVGFEVENLIDESMEPVWVQERTASQSLQPSDVLAARLAAWDDHWELATAYSIPDMDVLELLREIDERIDGDPSDPEIARGTGQFIVDYWVWLYTRQPVIPNLVTPDGDPIVMTTDHWEILDADELERRMAAESDVDGSREGGWVRLEDPDAAMGRPLLAVNPGKDASRLETFAQTLQKADDGRQWFEKVAGPSVRHITREVVDPMSEQNLGGAAPSADGPSITLSSSVNLTGGDDGLDMTPEMKTELMEQVYRQQYADIADDPVPMFGNKSPREVLLEPSGPKRIRLWIEGFERNEQQMAEHDGREPVDLGFVWEAMGLERPSR